MRLKTLKQHAIASCILRGHRMRRFVTLTTTTAESTCSACEKSVVVNSHPPANGIDIGGEAVALNCTEER